jgi:hypothetical protein
MIDLRLSIFFFPISWREEDQESNAKLLSQSLKTSQIIFEYVFRRQFFRNGEHRSTPKSTYSLEFIPFPQ